MKHFDKAPKKHLISLSRYHVFARVYLSFQLLYLSIFCDLEIILSRITTLYFAVLNIKTVFKVAAGGIVIASAFELLRRGSTYDQLVNAITTCVLPAGAKLVQITEGSVNLKVQAEHISALDTLWSLYKDGTLKERLEDLFITDKVTGIAVREQVEVTVTIDEQEYDKARKELSMQAQRGD